MPSGDSNRRRLLAVLGVVVVVAAAGFVVATVPRPDGGDSDPDQSTTASGGDTTTARTPTATGPPALAPMAGEFTIAEDPEVTPIGDAEPSDIVVLATQGYFPENHEADLVAFTTDGRVVYHEAEYGVYFDVDPVPGTKFTVEYLASKHFNDSTCNAVASRRCTRDVIRQVNLSTGESETVYAAVNRRIYSGRQHDADRINETHVAVADIVEDRVFILNTTSEEIVWLWNASDDFSRETGGKAGDWTHLNDVEVLPDDRLMASLRNQDSVVFLDSSKPGPEALQENWTLGEDGNYSILHKQHNPDYIPEERGGPSVLVGDSENDRVVEYRRENGSWERTWSYEQNLSWPRDADRLHNGNTAIVSTRNDRVIGVGPDDSVQWVVNVGMPYDVERLGTGDESATGMAARLRNESDGVAQSVGRVRPSARAPTTDVRSADVGSAVDATGVLGGSGLATVAVTLLVALAGMGLLGRRRR
jgi:hypothetical protein